MKLPLADIGKASEKGLVTALGELFGPSFRELGEYLADNVRFARARSLSKVLSEAKLLADLSGKSISPPSLKFLVPFLEKASLEDSDELMGMWARLLLAGGTSSDAHLIYFQDVISRIGSFEAKFLDQIAFDPIIKRGGIWTIEEARLQVQREILHSDLLYMSLNHEKWEWPFLLINKVEQFGVRVISCSCFLAAPEDSFDNLIWALSRKEEIAASLLEQLGIIRRIHHVNIEVDSAEVSIELLILTTIGVEFVYATHDPAWRAEGKDEGLDRPEVEFYEDMGAEKVQGYIKTWRAKRSSGD